MFEYKYKERLIFNLYFVLFVLRNFISFFINFRLSWNFFFVMLVEVLSINIRFNMLLYWLKIVFLWVFLEEFVVLILVYVNKVLMRFFWRLKVVVLIFLKFILFFILLLCCYVRWVIVYFCNLDVLMKENIVCNNYSNW